MSLYYYVRLYTFCYFVPVTFNAYKLAAFYLLYEWPNIHPKCVIIRTRWNIYEPTVLLPLPLNSLRLNNSLPLHRRIKGTCKRPACVELACAIITARPCYLLSAPSEMRPGDFVSKSRCKGTTKKRNKKMFLTEWNTFNVVCEHNNKINVC